MNMIVNPAYKREMRVSSRSFRLALVLLVFNGILALVALLNMYSMLAQPAGAVFSNQQRSAFICHSATSSHPVRSVRPDPVHTTALAADG